MGMIEQGKDLLQVVDLEKDGKAVAGEPAGGAHTFRMKKGVTYCGDRDAAVKALSLAFPACTFAWGKEIPRVTDKPAKK